MASGSRTPLVAVPVRNEAERLPALVSALARQTWLEDSRTRLRVVLVLNNCVDGSGEVVAHLSRRFDRLDLDAVEIDLPPDRAHVGTARRIAMDRALDGFDPAASAVLTTDADAVPAQDWVAENLRAIAQGADIVGGRIIGDPAEEARLGPGFRRRAAAFLDYAALGDRLASLLDPLFHDPWPRHQDHTGASLAVRGEVYAAVGGLPPLSFREDLAFVARVRAAGGRLRHEPRVRVQVSARLVGRAPGGMADCLKDWLRAEAEGRPILVEAPDAIARRLAFRRRLRELDGAAPVERVRIAASLGLDPRSLADPAGRPLSAATLIERFASDRPDAEGLVPVEAASIVLREMIAREEGECHAA